MGSSTSKIVQISQAPSATVHETLKPFTDQSGKKLKYEFYQIEDKKDNDKTPPKICYEKWIKKELEHIDNKLYILIGAKSAKTFFPNENYNDLIFKNNYLFGKLTLVLPHPSSLNIKWFKDNPDFMDKRIIEIRKIINDILNIEKSSKIP